MLDTDFRLPTAEEENAELAEVLGVDVSESFASVSQSQRDAIASYHLEGICAIDADLARYQESYELEKQLLMAKYERAMQPLRTERERKEGIVKLIASISEFGKKAKSRAVGWGRFGGKLNPAKLEVIDEPACLTWAQKSAPQLVRATVQLPLDKARAILDEGTLATARFDLPRAPLKEYFGATGEEIPGTKIEEASTEWYAKPEPLV